MYENRIAPLLLYAFCGLALVIPSVLEIIPEGVVNGILTFVGVAGLLAKNQFVERVSLLLTPAKHFPREETYTMVSPFAALLPAWRSMGMWSRTIIFF